MSVISEHALQLSPASDIATGIAKPPAPAQARFAFVDSLRGIAALAIMFFHLWWYYDNFSGDFVNEVMMRLRGGVQILLVISGFVIAYTLRRTWFTFNEVALFIGRRLVRLVPAYWVAIAIAMLTDVVCDYVWDLPKPIEGPHSISRTLAHMMFVQDILKHDALSAGLWTLCIEMQFYFVAILGWGLAQRLFPRPDVAKATPSAVGLLVVFAPWAIVCLFTWRQMSSTEHLVIHFLWMFFLGMITWWALDKAVPLPAFAIIIAIGLGDLCYNSDWRYQNTVALTTALMIFAAGYTQRLHVWLNWSPLQYLGKISYSLYLIHFPVSHLISSVGRQWYNDSPSPLETTLILSTAVIVSLVAAQLLYMLVEAPSARWAAWLKRFEVEASPRTASS